MTRKSLRSLAVLIAFAMAQAYIQLSFAEPTSSWAAFPLPQQFIARLSTSGGPVTVNGITTPHGASLLTGATIETPAAVSATIDLGTLGTIELEANSSIQLDFAADGTVRVRVLRGCVGIKKRGAGEGEIYTAEGASEKTNSKRKRMAFCYATGGLSAVGGAATAGIGGGVSVGAAAAVAGAAIAVPVTLYKTLRGMNPSTTAP